MPNKTTLVAAISGGVDSAVAAAVMQQHGYNIIGVTLKMKECNEKAEKRKSCCGIDDNIQAKLIAAKLGFPHYFHDVKPQFLTQVLQPTWNTYKHGQTPNPCILCNQHIKFGALLKFALSIGAKGIITGHYAKLIKNKNGHNTLHRANDPEKDQTYFLAQMNQQQLDLCYMPLAELTKTEVRQKARELNLSNADKQESQDACFGYKDETFATTLARFFQQIPPKGNLIDTKGNIIGKHQGIHNFTIGQRKGLGIALGKPAYVAKIDPQTNTVTITTNQQDLLSKQIIAQNINWLKKMPQQFQAQIQIRYRQKPIPATITKIDDNTIKAIPNQPLRAVTPGQTLAIYKNTQLIAGSTIITQ